MCGLLAAVKLAGKKCSGSLRDFNPRGSVLLVNHLPCTIYYSDKNLARAIDRKRSGANWRTPSAYFPII
jgi:hypothetical protein